tara:strand:+ start:550 stop:2544 length:1995 start_codon:yes stop_codon:yes gene_type:complete
MAQSAREIKEIAAAQKVANDAMKEGNNIAQQLGDLLKFSLDKQGKMNTALRDRVKILNEMKGRDEDAKKSAQKLFDIGKTIVQQEQKLKTARDEKGRFQKGFNHAITEQIKSNIQALKLEGESINLADVKADIYEGLVEKAKKFRDAITVTAIFSSLVSIAKKFGTAIDTIGQQFGSLPVMGKEFQTDLLRSSVEATKLGGGIQDVATITNTLASSFGMNVDEAAKLSSKVFDTSKALGLSADESANLFGSLTQVANLSAEQAETLAEGAFQLARQAGVAPSAVMKDIAGSAEEIALFTKDGGNNIAEAAVQARRMGLSLSQTAKIAEGLLDFENSITKEVEASVLLGKQLNFQKAREAALSGDIAGAMEEVVKQVGSEQDFLNLNLIQRKALADSIGVSVGEMAKLVGQSDKLTLSGAMASGNFEDLLGEEGISNISKLSGQFAALGATLVNSVGPVLSVIASGLNALLSPIASVLQGLEKMNLLGPVLTGTLTALGAAYATVKIHALASAAAQAKNIALSSVSIGKAVSLAVAEFFKGAGLMSGATLGFGTVAAIALAAGGVAALFSAMSKAKSVNDFTSGPGGITTMMGPAGVFSLNPRDSVLATTNPIPVNDMRTGPAGSMTPATSNVNVEIGGKISGRDIVFFQEQGAEFGDAPGNGLM